MQNNLRARFFWEASPFLLGIILLTVDSTSARAQSEPKRLDEMNWACTKDKEFLRDKDGKAVWLSSQQLESLLRKKTSVRTPGTLGKNNLRGTVTIQVLIGKDGAVECARAIKGHPAAISPALTAIRDWVFDPYIRDHEPHAVLGTISVEYDFSY